MKAAEVEDLKWRGRRNAGLRGEEEERDEDDDDSHSRHLSWTALTFDCYPRD